MPYGGTAARLRGDPGIFGFLGGLVKGVARNIPGPIGMVARQVLPTRSRAQPLSLSTALPGGMRLPVPRTFPGATRVPGIRGFAQRAVPGGRSGFELVGKRRRRINPANPKALRRAIRRQAGFIKLARRALKGTGYTIVSRGSRRPKRDLPPGHRHVR